MITCQLNVSLVEVFPLPSLSALSASVRTVALLKSDVSHQLYVRWRERTCVRPRLLQHMNRCIQACIRVALAIAECFCDQEGQYMFLVLDNDSPFT